MASQSSGSMPELQHTTVRSTHNVNTNDMPNQDTQSLTYANITQRINFPKKEQAIVLDAIDEISIKDYTFAVGNIINPRNIRFASRISNNRICLYLSDASIVQSLTKNKTSIHIKGHSIAIRPLITDSKRVLLSNVCPIIPHDVIFNKFCNLDINCTSAISFIKAGISDPGFSHILSFRRQVYISPEDISKLPDSIQITYDNTNYWIYITTDNPTCFFCKLEGHVAKKCPNLTEFNTTLTNTSSNEASSINKILKDDNKVESPAFATNEKNSLPSKRPLSVSTHSQSNSSSITTELPTVQMLPPQSTSNDLSSCFLPPDPTAVSSNPSKKKFKKDSPKTLASDPIDKIEPMLSPVKDNLLQHPENYILSYSQLKEFLNNSIGKKDIIKQATQYTSDLNSLLKMLQDIYPSLVDSSSKNRITRICKKIQLHIDWTAESANTSDESSAHTTLDPEIINNVTDSEGSTSSHPFTEEEHSNNHANKNDPI